VPPFAAAAAGRRNSAGDPRPRLQRPPMLPATGGAILPLTVDSRARRCQLPSRSRARLSPPTAPGQASRIRSGSLAGPGPVGCPVGDHAWSAPSSPASVGTSRDTSPAGATGIRQPDQARPALTEEITMCSALLYYLAQARITGLHGQVHRDAQARATRQARCTRTPQRGHRVGGLTAVMARRVRTALGGGSP
jgi:hypothetical protein